MKVTKRTWDVCRRCTFAEEGGGPKGKKTERERGGKEEGGAPRNAAQLLIRLRAQSASSRARGRRGPPPTSVRDLWIIFPPFSPLEQTRGDTRRRTRRARIESSEDIRSQKERKEFVTTDRNYTCSSYSSYYPFLSPERKFTLHARNSK